MSRGERHDGGSGAGQLGTLFLATVLGVGVGLLAAPQPGARTRRALRRRLAEAGEGLGEELEELRERGGKAGRKLRERAAELRERAEKRRRTIEDELAHAEDEDEDEDELEEEDEGSGVLPTVLTVAAGVAEAYLLTSERAAPARERVREAAATVRDEAEARWERYQSRRSPPADSTPTHS